MLELLAPVVRSRSCAMLVSVPGWACCAQAAPDSISEAASPAKTAECLLVLYGEARLARPESDTGSVLSIVKNVLECQQYLMTFLCQDEAGLNVLAGLTCLGKVCITPFFDENAFATH